MSAAVEAGTSPAVAPCSASHCHHPDTWPPHQPWSGGGPLQDPDRGRSWGLSLGTGALMLLMPVQFSFTSHLVLQACCQRVNELAELSMELCHLQHWSKGTSSEELLLWMRSQHQGKVLPPLAPVNFYTNCYLFTCIFMVDRSVPPHSCFTGLVPSGGATGENRAQVTRSPPHVGACASGRDIRGGGSWWPTPCRQWGGAACSHSHPKSDYTLTLFCRYLAPAQYSAETMLTPTLPCEELGLIISFVHRSSALEHRSGRWWGRSQWRRRCHHLPPPRKEK